MTAIGLFAGFFIAAIANINRPEIHKRLIMLATISLLQAAVARVFFVLVTGGGPGRGPGSVRRRRWPSRSCQACCSTC